MLIPDVELKITRDGEAVEASLAATFSRSRTDFVERIPINLDTTRLLSLSLDLDGYGAALTEMVFVPSLLQAWGQVVGFGKGATSSLRMRLVLEGDDSLHSIYWELLHNPTNNMPLALSEHIRFSRYLKNRQITTYREVDQPNLRAVVAVANPSSLNDVGLSPIDVVSEVGRAQAGFDTLEPVILDGRDKRLRASLAAIAATLRSGIEILYLVCHGVLVDGQTYLWLEHEGSGSKGPIPGSALAQVVEQLEQRPLLAILATCESAGSTYEVVSAVGPQLARAGIGAVLAMHGKISVDLVGVLLPILLTELQRDGQIDRALAAARAALPPRSPWWAITLWMTILDGRLWRDPTNESAIVELPPPTSQSRERDTAGQPGHGVNLQTQVSILTSTLPSLGGGSLLSEATTSQLYASLHILRAEVTSVWEKPELRVAIVKALHQALTDYDHRLEAAGEGEDPDASQQAYTALEVLEQVSVGLQLRQFEPAIAAGVLRRLGRRSMRRGDFLDATTLFQRASSLLGPKHVDEHAYLLRDYGLCYLHAEQFERAYTYAREAVEAAEDAHLVDRGEFYYLQALAAFETNQTQLFQSALDKAIQQYKAMHNSRRLADIETSKVLLLTYQGLAHKALETIAELLTDGQESVELRLIQTLALTECDQPDAALESAARAQALWYKRKPLDGTLQCKIHVAILDAHREQLRQLGGHNPSAKSYYAETVSPAYHRLHRLMSELGSDKGIEAERIDTEVCWGEASLLMGKQRSVVKALSAAKGYITRFQEADEADIVMSTIQYNLFAARVAASNGDYDTAINQSKEAVAQAQKHTSARQLLVPALLLQAELTLESGDTEYAEEIALEAQGIVQGGNSPHRLDAIQALLLRLQSL